MALREASLSQDGLTVSQALEFRGLIAYLAHSTVLYAHAFGDACSLPGLLWDTRFVYEAPPAPERVWRRPVVTPLVEDLAPGTELHSVPTAWHGPFKFHFNEQEIRAWRSRHLPDQNPDAWLGWQRRDNKARGQHLLYQQCGWPFIPYGRGHFLWAGDTTHSLCDGFCPTSRARSD